MSKSEIQPLIPLIRRGSQIIDPLLLRKRLPFLFAAAVSEDVVNLGEDIQDDIHDANGYQGAIAALVSGRIVRTIDIRGDDAGGLHKHIV